MTDLTYTIAIGGNNAQNYAHKARLLLDSIQKNTTATSEDVVIFITKNARDQIDKNLRSSFEQDSVFVTGELPNPSYPLSAAHTALVKAGRQTDNPYLLLLDADIVVLDDIDIQNMYSADLYLKPADIGTRYWAQNDSITRWEDLYNKFEFEFPTERVQTTVDKREILPYYNGGVILTKNNGFPERWRSLCKEIHNEIERSTFFSEMIALSLLSTDYEVHILNQLYNYPLNFYLTPPKDAKIIHYHDPISLVRAALLDADLNNKLTQLETWDKYGYNTRSLKLTYKLPADISNCLYFRRRGKTVEKHLRSSAIDILELTNTKHFVKKLVQK